MSRCQKKMIQLCHVTNIATLWVGIVNGVTK